MAERLLRLMRAASAQEVTAAGSAAGSATATVWTVVGNATLILQLVVAILSVIGISYSILFYRKKLKQLEREK